MLGLPDCAPGGASGLRILFLTDFHAREDLGAPEALERLAAQVNRIRPDLILGGGDCIHDGFGGPREQTRRRFEIFRAFAGRLRAPARWVIGNHDFAGAVDASGAVRPGDPTALFREALEVERCHDAFDVRGIRFILLQSVEVLGGKRGYRGYIDAEQQAWLKEVLTDTPTSQPLVVVSHIPFRTTVVQARQGSTEPLPGNLVVENAREVLALFAGRRLELVLQGHLHTDEQIRYNQTAFIMGGAVSGAWWKGDNRGTEEGFGDLRFQPGPGWSYRYLDYGWDARG